MATVNERNEKLNELLKVIRTSRLSSQYKKTLSEYVSGIKDNKRNNDFIDVDFLTRIMLEIITHYYNSEDALNLNNLIRAVKYIFPEGSKTEEYEKLQNLFVNNLSKYEKCFNKKFYAIFQDKRDYIDIIGIILDNEYYESCVDEIIDFAINVARYCQPQIILKQEIIAFINNLDTTDDIDQLAEDSLLEAKKRVGIYPVDEKTLSLIANEAKKVQSLIVKLEVLQRQVEEYRAEIPTLIANGKDDLARTTTESADKLQLIVSSAKEAILKELNDYKDALAKTLKESSDKAFNQVLIETSNKIDELKLAASGLTSLTQDELLRIQKQARESVGELKEYVENNPKVKELIKSAGGEARLKEILGHLQLTGQVPGAVAAVPVPVEGAGPAPVFIEGNPRGVVPMNAHVIIPDKIDHQIIAAFDESIPFDKRMKHIQDEMKRREKENNEIFHELTEEIVRCVMEGDWVYLWGPSGCGKSYAIKQVASLLGIDLVDNGKITDKYSVMAYNDPHGRFRATQAFIALVYGKMLALDEFDNGNTDTQVVLNELYSGLLDVLEKPHQKRFVTFAEDMSVPIHPNFRMISAGNTSGNGENSLFSSRGKIDEAVQERMTPKKFNYDNRVEQRILKAYPAWYTLFTKFRKICDTYASRNGFDSAPGIITTRDASAIAKYIGHNSKSIDQVLREKFIQVKDEQYLRDIMTLATEYYGFDAKEVDFDKHPENIVPTKDAKDVERALSSYKEDELGKVLIYTCGNAIKQMPSNKVK